MSIIDTQTRLLQTTRRLLLEKGLQATSMSLICKESKGLDGLRLSPVHQQGGADQRGIPRQPRPSVEGTPCRALR